MRQSKQPATNAAIWFEKGLTAQDQNQNTAATEAYLQVLHYDHKHFAATYNLANLYHEQNQRDLARQTYIDAIKLKPLSSLAYKGLGDIFFAQQEIEKARLIYYQAVKLQPDFAEAWHNIGLTEQNQNNLPEAMAAYRQAVKLRPDYESALTGLLNIAQRTHSVSETIVFLTDLASKSQKNHHLKLALAEIYYNNNQHEKALTQIHDSLTIDKFNGEAFNLLGLILLQRGESSLAHLHFNKARDLAPNSLKINSNMLYSCLNDPNSTPTEYLKEAKIWWRQHGAPLATTSLFKHKQSLINDRLLRLAFISGDFQRHSVSFFFLPLISNLPKNTFTTFCYSDTWKTDNYTLKIKEQADHWRSIYGLSNQTVAEMIETDKIDILIELSGHTANNRLEVIARQPAPVQFSWLGYPGTTGIANNTYRLSDKICDPQDYQAHYSETLTYISPPFLCYAPPAEVKNMPICKKDKSGNKIIFASFNNAAKINQKVVDIWSKILLQLPESSLLFRTRTLKDKSAAEFCKKRFSANGIDPERIIIDGNNYSVVEHFKSYNQVDIALDSFPYNGTTTTCDSLWMGTPVISLQGNTHASRVGTTLLQAVGCPELIADSENKYIEKAVNLANDSTRRTDYHTKIRLLMQSSTLMNAPKFAENFSHAILTRWNEWSSRRLEILQRLILEKGELMALPPNLEKLLPTNDTALTLLITSIENHTDLHLFLKLGQLYSNENRPNEALHCFRSAIADDTNNFTALFAMGHTLQKLDRDDEALHFYHKALQINPQLSCAAISLSSILLKQNESESALTVLLDAHNNSPEDSSINFQLANIYYDLNRLEKAYESLCRCIKFKPKQAGIWNNLGYLMAESGKSEKAAECYRQALSINPDLTESQTNLTWHLTQICSWQELYERQQKCNSLPPLLSIILEPDPQLNLESAKKALQKSTKETLIMSQSDHLSKERGDIIKIGYLSCDFRDHPVAHNMLNLFRLHDRNNFHITAYSCGKDDSSKYRQQIREDCDNFVDLQNLNDLESAKIIHADGIDILIELMGHTRENRLAICAFRPAPVQISYLGYPGTTGAEFIDYLIADETIIPVKDKIHYSENIIYLPNCFMIADRTPIGPLPKKSECGLPESGFIFCSFNTPFKIEPVMFKVWMDILAAVSDSYLWLRDGSERYEENLKMETKKHNIAPERLVFAPRVAQKEDHLARLQLADLALDTRIYNGHTTTLDALWAGVFASQVSDSNLKSIGLPEMIAKDLDTYRKTAIELAQNPEKLKHIRQKLKDNRLTRPLFDTEATVKNLETAYLKAWQHHLVPKD